MVHATREGDFAVLKILRPARSEPQISPRDPSTTADPSAGTRIAGWATGHKRRLLASLADKGDLQCSEATMSRRCWECWSAFSQPQRRPWAAAAAAPTDPRMSGEPPKARAAWAAVASRRAAIAAPSRAETRARAVASAAAVLRRAATAVPSRAEARARAVAWAAAATHPARAAWPPPAEVAAGAEAAAGPR